MVVGTTPAHMQGPNLMTTPVRKYAREDDHQYGMYAVRKYTVKQARAYQQGGTLNHKCNGDAIEQRSIPGLVMLPN